MLSTSGLPLRRPARRAATEAPSCPGSTPGGALQVGVVALVLILSCLSALASLPRATPTAAEPFALVFPPWTSAQSAAAFSFAAGFRVLRGGAWPFVAIVVGPDDRLAPALPEAAFALNLSGLAGCLDSPRVRETLP